MRGSPVRQGCCTRPRLLALRDLLNSGTEGGYRCVYANVEAAQAAREDTERSMRAILSELATGRARRWATERWPGCGPAFLPRPGRTACFARC